MFTLYGNVRKELNSEEDRKMLNTLCNPFVGIFAWQWLWALNSIAFFLLSLYINLLGMRGRGIFLPCGRCHSVPSISTNTLKGMHPLKNKNSIVELYVVFIRHLSIFFLAKYIKNIFKCWFCDKNAGEANSNSEEKKYEINAMYPQYLTKTFALHSPLHLISDTTNSKYASVGQQIASSIQKTKKKRSEFHLFVLCIWHPK